MVNKLSLSSSREESSRKKGFKFWILIAFFVLIFTIQNLSSIQPNLQSILVNIKQTDQQHQHYYYGKGGGGRSAILEGIKQSARRLVPCLYNATVICRFDHVGQFLEDNINDNYDENENGNTRKNPPFNFVHPPVQAVPKYRRYTHEMANNRTQFVRGFTSYPDDPYNTDARNSTLTEYNPTILPLYKNNGTVITTDFDKTLLDDLTGRWYQSSNSSDDVGFTDAEIDQVQYISVSRSTNLHPHCIINGSFNKKKDKGYEWVNYPTISLLDYNLRPIDGADVVIDIEKYYFTTTNTRVFQDFTIYAAATTKGNTKKDHLFLLANGMYILPIAIRRIPPQSQSSSTQPPSTSSAAVTGSGSGDGNVNTEIIVENSDIEPSISSSSSSSWETKIKHKSLSQDVLYGSGLEVRLFHPDTNFEPSPVRKRGLSKKLIFFGGKNLHPFEDKNGMTFIEIWPYSNHTVERINFFSDEFTSVNDLKLLRGGGGDGGGGGGDDDDKVERITAANLDYRESFNSKVGRLPRKKPVNRGTACCLDMTLSDGREVKIGIAHSVVRPLTYLHRFYAFLPESPFPVIKFSGLFCFGHMKTNDRDTESLWVSSASHTFKPRKERISYIEFDCPEITFATGITEMIGYGGEYVVISYGVDDCYSRSIVVHKKKIEMLLFGE